MSMAYNELYKIAEPGAMNLIMLETDGLPNTLVYNFYQTPGTTSTLALNTSSGCEDANNKTVEPGRLARPRHRSAVDPVHLHEYERHRIHVRRPSRHDRRSLYAPTRRKDRRTT